MRIRWVTGMFAVGALLLAASTNAAQEKKVAEPHSKADLNESLRSVINVGADLFNNQGDHAGCYRMYQGALIAVKPFLNPELQRKVDAGLVTADRLPAFSDRAFELRKVIDEVRAATKAGPRVETKVEEKKAEEKKVPEKKVETKKVEEKKAPEKKTEEKKVEEKKPAEEKGDKGQVSGTVTIDGVPLPKGYVVTLVSEQERKFSSTLTAEGAFRFTTPLAPGKYRVVVEPFNDGGGNEKSAVPARYRSEQTSGLTVEVRPGRNNFQLNLAR